jgi:hypothetical protein
MADTSDSEKGVALATFRDRLWIAWAGEDNKQLNVMGSVNGNDFDSTTKQVMGDTADETPSLVVHGDRLWIVWSGVDNLQPNIMSSGAGNDFDSTTRRTFEGGLVFGQGAVSAVGALWLSGQALLDPLTLWRLLKIDTDASSGEEGRVATEITRMPPALTLFEDKVLVAWTGVDDERHLNLGRLSLF